MVDRTAATQPTNEGYLLAAQIRKIGFQRGKLIAPNDNTGSIAPNQQVGGTRAHSRPEEPAKCQRQVIKSDDRKSKTSLQSRDSCTDHRKRMYRQWSAFRKAFDVATLASRDCIAFSLAPPEFGCSRNAISQRDSATSTGCSETSSDTVRTSNRFIHQSSRQSSGGVGQPHLPLGSSLPSEIASSSSRRRPPLGRSRSLRLRTRPCALVSHARGLQERRSTTEQCAS